MGSRSPVSGRIHAEPTGPAAPRVQRRLSALLSKGPNTTRRDTSGPSPSSAAAARRIDHETAFVSEVALLSRVNHKNLVHFLSFCADGGKRILVYEFMPNGTHHKHLHKRPPPLSPPLASWPARLRLAFGAACGIEYMHTYAVPPVIHRDIKSSNILLDAF
ncbi:hypothetical protein E2562_025803 [Oryza meyeriana var. granulata]|uniref:Protein kinase domain-containing protein n=1 Tax=Oryza meyeriana var. granulata TaxID=110450 RepID=A0A6G1CSS2_9ORYZ|nr:hypothetical protein E2562_025803 [Oryza meyeriana var. granulata]